jgi:hypothetical protein
MALDDGIGQSNPHPVPARSIKCVLKARERRLRGQLLARRRIPITQELGVDHQCPQQDRPIVEAGMLLLTSRRQRAPA